MRLIEVGGVVLFIHPSVMFCGVELGEGGYIHPDTNLDLQRVLDPRTDPASLSPPPHLSALEPQLHSPPLVSLPLLEESQVKWVAWVVW